MAKKPLPTPDELRQLLTYDPDTGRLFWKERTPDMFDDGTIRDQGRVIKCIRWNAKYAGKPAFAAMSGSGCPHGSLGGRHMNAHRVVWAMFHGAWPVGDVDHINGNRADNRIVNLRDVPHAENQRNMRRRKDNTSGHNGVTFNAISKIWVAQIGLAGRGIYLGGFKSKDDAIAARIRGEQALGFHPLHGTVKTTS